MIPPLGLLLASRPSRGFTPLMLRGILSVDFKHILTVNLLIRSKASLQAWAGGHFSTKSPSTEVAASIVKSISSIGNFARTTGECQIA